MFTKKSTISIVLDEKTLFLHPCTTSSSLPLLSAEPTTDTVLRGSVVIDLVKPREFKSIVVKLGGWCDIAFPDSAPESAKCLEKEVVIKLEGQDRLMEKGKHSFRFGIIIPSSAAPCERCLYGRVYHRVQAIAKATSLVAGDLEAEERSLFLIANHAGQDEPPEPLDARMDGFFDELGPYGINLTSPHLTISGLIRFHLYLPSPPTTIVITSITCYILQSFTLRSLINPKLISRPPAQRRRLFILDPQHAARDRTREEWQPPTPPTEPPSSPSPIATFPATIDPREPYEIYHLARVPNDDNVRATTPDKTETGLRVSHKLVVEIRYTNADPQHMKGKFKEDVRVLKAIKDVTISSCSCLLDSLLLPVYSPSDPLAVSRDPPLLCTCEMSMEKLMMEQQSWSDSRLTPREAARDFRLDAGKILLRAEAGV